MNLAYDWCCPQDVSHPVAVDPLVGWPSCLACAAVPSLDERVEWASAVALQVLVPRPSTRLARRVGSGAALVCFATSMVDDETMIVGHMCPKSSLFSDLGVTRKDVWTACLSMVASRMLLGASSAAVTLTSRFDVYPVGFLRSGSLEIIRPDLLNQWLDDPVRH